MSKSAALSVTAEEAVALMINMDYIPSDFTLDDMLDAFSEEAEVAYENARIDRLAGSQSIAPGLASWRATIPHRIHSVMAPRAGDSSPRVWAIGGGPLHTRESYREGGGLSYTEAYSQTADGL